MRIKFLIFFFLCFGFRSYAQVQFKTVVPRHTITVNESFRVQYILEGSEKISGFHAPVFNNFRLVAGPDRYTSTDPALKGSGIRWNTVFTLEALQPGKFIIPGATIMVNGTFMQSADAVVEVVSKEAADNPYRKEADNSSYFLKPGENPYQKIDQNLFLKLTVDKRSCYVGEPVVATFKLYSRLESISDVVKNPGFYGFTVFDVINLADDFVSLEMINNKAFDVHTIRKVQLFPLQAGLFTIDPMELTNKIEFTRSAVYKKTEQRITEGVLGVDDTEQNRDNTIVFEKSLRTEPIEIDVKPLPAGKPASFSGAVGNFNLDVSLSGNTQQKTEQGFLNITVKGEGNFIQLTPPLINWPQGLEGFDPQVSDSFSTTTSPLSGKRTYRYPFIASQPGNYSIPSVDFSFFNPDSGKYKKLETPRQLITINKASPSPLWVPFTETETTTKKHNGPVIYFLVTLIILSGLSLFFIRRSIKQKKIPPPVPNVRTNKTFATVNELLLPAVMNLPLEDAGFYSSLYQAVWFFFMDRFDLAGSGVSKENLLMILRNKNMQEQLVDGVQDILLACERGRFTGAGMTGDKKQLLDKIKYLLEKIDHSLL